MPPSTYEYILTKRFSASSPILNSILGRKEGLIVVFFNSLYGCQCIGGGGGDEGRRRKKFVNLIMPP
jgi:hypothetical protein